MGVNCCSHEKESPEITIQKPEKKIIVDNNKVNASQEKKNLVNINSSPNSQSLRSPSPNYSQKKNIYQSPYQSTHSSKSPSPIIENQNKLYQYKNQESQLSNNISSNIYSKDLIYQNQTLDQNLMNSPQNIDIQNIFHQNQNTNQNSNHPMLIPIKNDNNNTSSIILDTNSNQINNFSPQISSQIININENENVNNQVIDEPFKLDIFTTNNSNTNNPLGFNKNEIDNIFDKAFKSVGFPGKDIPSTTQNLNSNNSNLNGLNNLQIYNIPNQNQNIQNVNIDELIKQQNNKTDSKINDLFLLNNNEINNISKSFQPQLAILYQNSIKEQQNPLAFSTYPPQLMNINNSISINQYSQNNSPIEGGNSGTQISPLNQFDSSQPIGNMNYYQLNL